MPLAARYLSLCLSLCQVFNGIWFRKGCWGLGGGILSRLVKLCFQTQAVENYTTECQICGRRNRDLRTKDHCWKVTDYLYKGLERPRSSEHAVLDLDFPHEKRARNAVEQPLCCDRLSSKSSKSGHKRGLIHRRGFKSNVALRSQRPYGLLGTGSPGRPPRLHTAPELWRCTRTQLS